MRVGWAPQRPAQYGRLTPRENLELFARLEGEADPRAAADAAARASSSCRTTARRRGALSVGNRQRLNLALALLGARDVLLLDEPTAALDPRSGGASGGRAAAPRARGGAVVFATQNHEEIEARRPRRSCCRGPPRVRRAARGVRAAELARTLA